jgi:pimeloyl-ACP methyl ester carboxylesterase
MAPEQAAADPHVDHRADLYAWGVVAYEALSGRHPFADRTTPGALLAAHLTERPAPLATLLPELPAAVADVVMRCLEKDPGARPRDAGELLAALDVTSAWQATPPRRRLTEHAFRLSEPVLRRLDRAALDPRMFGDALHYLENDAPAGVLLFCVHGMGHEGAEFARLMETTRHRAVAPTLYGFDPAPERERVPVPADAHIALLRELLRDAVARLAPARVVLVGFSSGGDLVMRMLADAPADAPRVDACLALGPNLSLATCFVTRVFARLEGGDTRALLADLQRMGDDAADLDEWLNLMTYQLHSLRKFRGDVAPLSRLAAGVVRPFAEGSEGGDAFAGWFRAASERAAVLRCVFERSATCVELVHALRLRHFDDGVLGPRYREDALVLESTADHFALLEPPLIERHLDAIVAALR